MKLRTQQKKINVLEHAFAACAGEYYSINLTKNLVPGVMYQVIDDEEYNVNEQLGLPENASFTDVISCWGKKLIDEDKESYFEFFKISNLIEQYRKGKYHVSHRYWTTTALFKPMLAEQHIVMFSDEETGDILAITYVLDLTEKNKEEAYKKELEKSKERLESNLVENTVLLHTERQYLDILTHDFSAVYDVNLNENTSKLIKVDSKIGYYNIDKICLRQENNYFERVDDYSRKFVAPNFQQEFRRVMGAKYLLEKMETCNRFIYRYGTTQANGETRYFEVIAFRMPANFKKGHILIGFRDINDEVTEEQRHQLELEERLEIERQQNEVLSALGRNYHVIININLKKDIYQIISCRDEVRDYYNTKQTSASKLLEEVCETIVDSKYKERIHKFLDLSTIVQRLEHRDFVEAECITKKGNWHRLRIIVKRRDEHGKVTNVLYVNQVIDDEKQYEEHLIAKAEYADYANKAKTDFISQVAHDIRTPMNSIFGFLEIAEANLDDLDKVKYSLEKIRTAGEFLKDLVNDVLDISRMENGAMKFSPKKIDFVSMMEEFLISMENAKFDKKHQFHLNIHDILYRGIEADALRLKQIYANILSNAIKYTPDGGRIDFDVYQEKIEDSNRIRIIATITDTGIGMSEEFMDKMFNKFERAVDTRVNTVNGYGLGLSIVKRLVGMMDGDLDVQSKLGEGTRVCIKLDVPYVKDMIEELPEKETDYTTLCAGMHILVAEDNELNQEVITELLSMNNISCECAEDGDICVRKFMDAKPQSYDAILMDMQMPNMNGIEAARKIRSLPSLDAKNIPIIAMTANVLKEDVQKCMEAGMNQHLPKPVDIQLLLKTLAEIKNIRRN